MRRAIFSSLFSLLLVATLVWGGCVSCEQFFMLGGAKKCCSPNGHCTTKSPAKQQTVTSCKQIAFDHHDPADFHIDLPVTAFASAASFNRPVAVFLHWYEPAAIDPSPPDLRILHSSFLI